MTTLPRWYRKLRAKLDATPQGETAAAALPSPSESVPAAPADGTVASEAVPAEAIAAPEPAAEPVSVAAAPPASRGASRLFEVKRRTVPKIVRTAKAAMAKAGTASAAPWQRPAIAAAAIIVAGGLGYAGGLSAGKRGEGETLAAQRIGEAASDIRQSREEAGRLAAEMKSMRVAVDSLKGERDRARTDLGKQAQLSERVEKSTVEATGRIGKLSEQLDRIEKTQRDPARIASLVDRLDRIERQMQIASASPQGAPTPPPKPVATLAAPAPEVTTTGSLPDPKPLAKPVEADHRKIQVEGYVLRDIEDGVALIEARNGRYFEVSPGMNLPGIGRVEAIERRGRQWVVVTPKGFIAER